MTKIDSLRQIVETKSMSGVDGLMIDFTTASGLVHFYDKAGQTSKDKFEQLTIQQLVGFLYGKKIND